MRDSFSQFITQAETILGLKIAHRVNRLGGYGSGGEVIYEAHPPACPSTLVDHQGPATATFQTNGSLDFEIKLDQGLDVRVLEGSFDPVEKRETGVLSSNCWIEIDKGGAKHIASLINPRIHQSLSADWIKIIKLGDPERAIWYCAGFNEDCLQTAVRLRLAMQTQGPAIVREIYVRSNGQKPIRGNLWTYFDLHGTQRFSYHKNLWYDAGLPINPCGTVTAATVPHENIPQIKRVSSQAYQCQPEEATCDYTGFIGDSGASALLPAAIQHGCLLETGAGASLNRFSSASISASRFSFSLEGGMTAAVLQSLLYVTAPETVRRFRELSACENADYPSISYSFRTAAEDLIAQAGGQDFEVPAAPPHFDPPFAVDLPTEPAIATYINSAWTGVEELYEKCRGHGARLADGIELGTRDRAQDMGTKLKEDPARVRQDLLHALGFMYITEEPLAGWTKLTLRQKLHGMFPRQYPSRWLDREAAVHNDNRPYADSPLWLVEALALYLCETGDRSILLEEVSAVHLNDPDHPEISGIVGAENSYKVAEVVAQVFTSYFRHIADSPYSLAQILFGDWCDPVDMFGTSEVGDLSTRGQGRGAQVRLSAHLFLCLVAMIDILEIPSIRSMLLRAKILPDVDLWKEKANQLRAAILKWGWEGNGFIDCIHEKNADATTPDYARGDRGYTLGSMKGMDFDGVNRRVLTVQAYGLGMLCTERAYLEPIPGGQAMTRSLLETVDTLFYKEQLGLMLFSSPIANSPQAVRLVGRMGIVPAGCAENGEYHHAQMFMHRFRLNVSAEADRVWEQFQPVLSVTRDDNIGGPFDMTSNSFASDPADPHFGQGMYFGLSGSVDWMVNVFQKIAGVELALHDERQPALRISPTLPPTLEGRLTFKRIIFQSLPDGEFRKVPLSIICKKADAVNCPGITINGESVESAVVWNLQTYDRLEVQIVS
jgi:hypothetical protein